MAELLNKIPTNLTEYPNSFKRQGAFPLEAYEVHYSLSAAKTYAESNSLAYVGQTLAVVEGTNVNLYVIADTNGTLKEVSSSVVLDDLVEKVAINTQAIADEKLAREEAIGNPSSTDGDNKVEATGIYAVIEAAETRSINRENKIKADILHDESNIEGRLSAIESDFIDSDKLDKAIEGLATVNYVDDEIDKVEEAIGNLIHFSTEVIDDISQVTQPNVLYLKKIENASGSDIYEEYILIDNQATLIGDTSTNLSNYATLDDVTNGIAHKLDANGWVSNETNDGWKYESEDFIGFASICPSEIHLQGENFDGLTLNPRIVSLYDGDKNHLSFNVNGTIHYSVEDLADEIPDSNYIVDATISLPTESGKLALISDIDTKLEDKADKADVYSKDYIDNIVIEIYDNQATITGSITDLENEVFTNYAKSEDVYIKVANIDISEETNKITVSDSENNTQYSELASTGLCVSDEISDAQKRTYYGLSGISINKINSNTSEDLTFSLNFPEAEGTLATIEQVNASISGINTELAKKAYISNVYNKNEIDAKIGIPGIPEEKDAEGNIIAEAVTGTGIFSNTYSKAEINSMLDKIEGGSTESAESVKRQLDEYKSYNNEKVSALELASANFMTESQVDARINTLIAAADPDGDGNVITNIQNLVEYVENNAASIAQLITDTKNNTDKLVNIDTTVAEAIEAAKEEIIAAIPALEVATTEKLGGVKSASDITIGEGETATTKIAENAVYVGTSGVGTVKAVNIKTLVQDDGDIIILNGGSAKI